MPPVPVALDVPVALEMASTVGFVGTVLAFMPLGRVAGVDV